MTPDGHVVSSSGRREAMRLCEREGEVAAIRAAVRAAHAGHGSLTAVVGPLGIGRTALLRSVADQLEETADTRVVLASGAPLEREFAHGVTRQLFEPAIWSADPERRSRWFAGAAAPAAPLLDADPGPPDPGPPEPVPPATLWPALRALAANLAAERPLLVVVDDLQWVDTESLRWLGYLARRLAGVPVTVVAAAWDVGCWSERPDVQDVLAAATRTLRPRPLGVDAARTLARDRFGAPVEEEFVTRAHAASGGNPMFLTGILDAVASSGAPATADQLTAEDSPWSGLLGDRLTTWLDAVVAPVRDVGRAVLVLGEEATPELVADLVGLDQLTCDRSLHVLGQLGLVHVDGTCSFRHPCASAAVDRAMGVAERERLRQAAALLLHQRGRPPERVAEHLLAVTTPQHAWATRVLREAADTALRRGAPRKAADYLRRLLLDVDDGVVRARLLVELALAEREFDRAAARRHLTQAVPLLPHPRERAVAATRLAPELLDEVTPAVRELLGRAEADLRSGEPLTGQDPEIALRVECRVRRAGLAPDTEDSVLDRLRDLDVVPGGRTPAERELVSVLLHQATGGLLLSSDAVGRIGRAVLAGEPAAARHVHTGLVLLPPTLVAADAAEDVGTWLDIALDQARRQNSVVARVLVSVGLVSVRLGAGDVTGARTCGLDAVALAESEWPDGLPLCLAALVPTALLPRDARMARWLLDRLERHATGSEGAAYHHDALLPLRGFLRSHAGDLPGALHHVQECGQLLARAGRRNPALSPWRHWATSLHLRMGDPAAARAVAAEEYDLAVRWGAPATLGAALRLLGTVTDGRRGIELLRESRRVLAGSGNRLELGRTLAELGRALLRAGDPAAEPVLREGHDLTADRGIDWLTDRFRFDLAACSRASGVDLVLTRAELRVAVLAAEGRTNKEIADTLTVSVRAVEKHLTRVYRKLAVDGRSGLAAALVPVSTGPGDPSTRAC
ncbi:AAA family ATPase [Actinoalloteichus caeruleus]|nr:LuxR family transcriptional regulator [Actinoalloteichus caeruleus]